MARSHARKLRVAAEIHRLVDDLLRTEVRDPRLETVRVNAVDVSGDLSVAKVYFSLLEPDADPAPAEQALQKAAGFLRSKTARELKLRHAPELRFLHDESVKRAIELTRLIEEASGGVGDPEPPKD